jgi:ATP-grasp domain, R2K clade family 2
MDHEILIIPSKPDVERDSVAAAWTARGGSVLRLDRFWVLPDVEPGRVALYGADTFCLVLAQLLGLDLVSPQDDLLVRADRGLTKRAIRRVSLADALRGPFPVFAKPLVPKQFRAAVWRSADELGAECAGLEADAEVITSEVVAIRAEARAWILDRQVVTCAVYEGEAPVGEASRFAETCAEGLALPATCVVDIALVEDGWCLLEGNAAWGAGLNGCDPAAAVRCIDRATRLRRNAS